MDELVIFDRSGIAKVFVSEGVFYDYTGRPLAFLDYENIVSYSGKHLGWFQNGYIRDTHGDAVGFTEGRTRWTNHAYTRHTTDSTNSSDSAYPANTTDSAYPSDLLV